MAEAGDTKPRGQRRPNLKRRAGVIRDKLLRELGDVPTQSELLLAEAGAALALRLKREAGDGAEALATAHLLRRVLADLARARRSRRRAA